MPGYDGGVWGLGLGVGFGFRFGVWDLGLEFGCRGVRVWGDALRILSFVEEYHDRYLIC